VKVKRGDKYERWTVIRESAPGRRSDGKVVPRVLVRCVCGVEKTLFAHYLRQGRSKGCRSARCRHRYAAATLIRQDLVDAVDKVIVQYLGGEDECDWL
jgi:hypothetical protein